MADQDNKKCRLCRASGKKLFLKGARCFSVKCPMHSNSAAIPGQTHTARRRRLSDYGTQLKEKQELKRVYGIREGSLKKYFQEARRQKKATGELLLQFLETRLDNVVFRLGFSNSRRMARQLVGHRHVVVDGKKVNIPSFRVYPGTVISLDDQAVKIPEVKKTLADKDYQLPKWVERKASVGKFVRWPARDEIELNVNEQLIVEFYSR